MSRSLSYKDSGVDIDAADDTKRAMAASLETSDSRVLNRIGAFASLFEASFPGYQHPVLVLKTEEPGSKQKLAFEHGRVRSICFDMINHLVNDIAVMGATPLTVQDAIICGKLEKEVVKQIVASVAEACRAQGCTLTGGETSEQPGVVPAGTCILTSSIVGVVEKARIVDGSRIEAGDAVLAVSSNGLHTNGYSLVRALINKEPSVIDEQFVNHEGEQERFLDAILRPHLCYYQGLKVLYPLPELHGLAHITGGGIPGNLNRIIPPGLSARIDLNAIRILPVFKFIRSKAQTSDADMLRTFNLGVGLNVVCQAGAADGFIKTLAAQGYEASRIGEVVQDSEPVSFTGKLGW